MLWIHLIAGSSIASEQLLTLIGGVIRGQSLHRVWHAGAFDFSITTAYRWLARWRRNLAHLRTHLSRTRSPPNEEHTSACQRTFLHLTQAYAQRSCPITAFQHQHQQHFLPN